VAENGINTSSYLKLMEIKKIIEALLFAATEPLSVKQLQLIFPETERPETKAITLAIDSLMMDYSTHAIELKQLATGYRFQVRADFSPWISRLFEEKPPRYSRALLETLAIIAYRQPVTRTEIEEIRGVSVSSHLISTLLEREWIQSLGQKPVPGSPTLFGTTKQFLDYFNLSSLAQLPKLAKLQEWDEVAINLQQNQQVNSEQQLIIQTSLPDTAEKSRSGTKEN
jgi:segregation and condensation protein B